MICETTFGRLLLQMDINELANGSYLLLRETLILGRELLSVLIFIGNAW